MTDSVVKTLCDLVEDLCEGRETYVHEYVDVALKAANYIEELEAKLAKAVEALVMIADGPSEMVWGVDSEVREKMREMESIAELTLAELKGQDNA